MVIDYFYGPAANQFRYYLLPEILLTHEELKTMSGDAKILYSILLSRTSLSYENGWLDEKNRVYIICTVEEIMESLCCATQKAAKLLAELETSGLIERKRQGLGKPNLLYVKDFTTLITSKFKNFENQNSRTSEIKNK